MGLGVCERETPTSVGERRSVSACRRAAPASRSAASRGGRKMSARSERNGRLAAGRMGMEGMGIEGLNKQGKEEEVVLVLVLVLGEQQVVPVVLQVVRWCPEHRMPSKLWHRLLSVLTIDM
nr:unnamed protein product [Digitaria exilis]